MIQRIIAFLSGCILVFLALPALAASPPVTRLDLGKGAQGLMIVDRSLPLVTLQLTFLYAGGVSDPADQPGRAYLASQLLPEGAGDYDGQEFRRLLEAKAIHLGASPTQDNLVVVVKTLSENLPEAIRLLTVMLGEPHFAKQALERKKEEIHSRLREAAQDPGWQASREWHRRAYGTHAYARPLEGTEPSITTLTVKDVQQWHDQTLTRDRLLISAVGDVEAPRLAGLLQPLLAALPKKSTLPLPVDAPLPPTGIDPVTVTQEVPQSIAIFGLPGLKRDDPDFYAAYLLNHILGGGTLVSRLSHSIREEKGLAYSVNTMLSQQLFSPLILGSFATRNAQIGAAVAELQAVLERTAAKGVTAEELQHAKDYLTGSFALELDKQSARAGYLSSMLIYHLGEDYLEKRNGYFEAVTLAQINRLAKKLLAPSPLLVVAGKPEKPLHWSHHDTPLPAEH